MRNSFRDFIIEISRQPKLEERKEMMGQELSRIRNRLKMKEKSRHLRIIAKLIFLNHAGYDVSFSLVEIANVMASTRFSTKFIGYIAAGILFDPKSETYLLINQTVLNDLKFYEERVQCLALSLIANYKGSDLIANAFSSIENIIMKSRSFRVLKCAGAALISCIRENPDYIESVKKCIPSLLGNQSHAVKIVGLKIVSEILKNIENKTRFQSMISTCIELIRTLRNIYPTRAHGFVGENDPFAQIFAIKTLGMIGKPSDEIDSLLQSIITTLDPSTNIGKSILLEAVETIVKTCKNQSLKTLAINQIGRLLNPNNPGTCYSILSALTRILYSDKNMINRGSADNLSTQRYRDQIVQCLEQDDVSIKRRALVVITAIVNEQNVKKLVPDIMEHMKSVDKDFLADIVPKLFTCIERFAPSPQWKIDILIRLVKENPSYINKEILNSFCSFVSNSNEICSFALNRIEEELPNNKNNQPFIQMASFCIGEYGEKADYYLNIFQSIIFSPGISGTTICYLLSSIAKIAIKFDLINKIINVIGKFCGDHRIEVQQRAGEIIRILKSGNSLNIYCPMKQIGTSSPSRIRSKSYTQNTNDNAKLVDFERENDQIRKRNITQPVTYQSKTDIDINITPPRGSIEVIQTSDFILFFEIQKNENDNRQIAIRTSFFSKSKISLPEFSAKYAVPNGWNLKAQAPSSNILLPYGESPIQQVLLLMNQGVENLTMKVWISFMFHGQTITSIYDINKIID